MNVKNNKGFSLIELMVTVGIIGIITMIAIPNFQKFQAKAKQANARTELSGIYGMEKAFFTEFGHFHANLPLIGYVPDGYPMTGNCPVSGAISNSASATRYYFTGFQGATGAGRAAVGTAPVGASLPCGNIQHYEATLTVANLANSGNAPTIAEDSFKAVARGNIISATKADVWTIDNNKFTSNVEAGF